MVQTFPIGNDQCDRLFPPGPNHNNLTNKLTLLQQTLDQLWRDILPVRQFEEILFPVSDVKLTILLHVTDVAGVKPTILQHGCGGFGLSIVTPHHVWTTDENLAVFSNLDLDTIERNPDRSDAIVPRPVRRHDARFSRSVSLQDRNSRRAKRVRQRRRKRRATGNEISQTPADSLAPFRKHQLAGELLFDC